MAPLSSRKWRYINSCIIIWLLFMIMMMMMMMMMMTYNTSRAPQQTTYQKYHYKQKKRMNHFKRNNTTNKHIDQRCHYKNTMNRLPKISTANILGDPGAVSRGRAKWRDESFQERAEEPLGTKSHRTISKRLREYRLLIGQKKSLVLFCPIRSQYSQSRLEMVR